MSKTVFISYRRDTAGKYFARSIKDALTHQGYDVFLDVDCFDAGKWSAQILTQVPERAHFLLLLTPGALDRCADEGDWVRKEFLEAVRTNRNIVPIREESVDLGQLRSSCPECMLPVFDRQIAAIQHASFANDVATLIQRFIAPRMAPKVESAATPSQKFCRVDIERISKYAPAELIGREAEIELLHDAWDRVVSHTPKRAHILTFVAMGGEGKTSLVAKWAADLAHRDWPGCEAAFAWSFYSQGTRDQSSASSDSFFAEALKFFGDEETANSPLGAYEKGKRLARLVGERRALLILDGVEPLQYVPGPPMNGKLKDQGIEALLKGMASSSRGLCIVTTRYSIPDLKNFWQTTAPEQKLARLSMAAGVYLLQSLGVKGTERREILAADGTTKLNEYEKLVEDVRGHALTLNLLGSYLRDAHNGDIRRRDLIHLEEADAEEQGGHAFRVMDAYVKSFEGEGENGLLALAILKLLGLFDRPATSDCLNVLWSGLPIEGLTELLVGLSEPKRNIVLNRLESAGLVTVHRDAGYQLNSIDTHPLLRDYFARRLKSSTRPWQVSHERLFRHLCAIAPASTKNGRIQSAIRSSSPSLSDLLPLYQAIPHGCFSGLYSEAYEDVYGDRILRVPEFYSTNKLGCIGLDLV